jgi:hypothetical protein
LKYSVNSSIYKAAPNDTCVLSVVENVLKEWEGIPIKLHRVTQSLYLFKIFKGSEKVFPELPHLCRWDIITLPDLIKSGNFHSAV